MLKNGWGIDIEFPLLNRRLKPRNIGLTMVLDKGLGVRETEELLDIAGDYIDFLKLSFGTSALYSPHVLHKKIDLVKSYGVDIYPGGTFLEVVLLQGKLEQYLNRARELGFTCVEISDGTIQLDRALRREAIRQAVNLGFKVLTEVGKKDANEVFLPEEMVRQLNEDLDNGAYRVIIEGRESGTVGMYNSLGDLDQQIFETLLRGVPSPELIIWEAPQKKQQVHLIKSLGNNVNLGNISSNDILAVEALRNGLRGDTFKETISRFPSNLSENLSKNLLEN